MHRLAAPAFLLLMLGCPNEGGPALDSEGSTAEDPTAGSTSSASSADTQTGAPARYHPEGFAAPEIHGPALKLHQEDCRSCHGADLMGGPIEPSCDSCHSTGWRTDCVYCHGGTNDATGAPPRDIDGTTDTMLLSFIAHRRHVNENVHAAYGCEQCHTTPTDVLSEGHVFDDTDARAEVSFVAGLSPEGAWDGAGSCAALYCHGNGNGNGNSGSYSHDLPAPSCGGCHPYPGTENIAYATMSGQHARHAAEGLACSECHDASGVLLHVDGEPDVAISAAGFDFDPTTRHCTGTCHSRVHVSEVW